jgi:hypothetical protein
MTYKTTENGNIRMQSINGGTNREAKYSGTIMALHILPGMLDCIADWGGDSSVLRADYHE